MIAPSASISRRASMVPAGSGPFIARSPATSTTSGFSFLIALRTASSAGSTPWTSERTARRTLTTHSRRIARERRPQLVESPSSQDAIGRDDEAEGGLAGHLAVHAGDPAAAPEARPELRHRHLEAERVAGDHDALEAGLVDGCEQPDAVAEAGLLGDVDGHRLGEGLDLEDAGHDRQPREVALGPPLGRRDALEPDDSLGLGVVLDDPVDHEDGPAMRDERLDLLRRVDRPRPRQGIRN